MSAAIMHATTFPIIVFGIGYIVSTAEHARDSSGAVRATIDAFIIITITLPLDTHPSHVQPCRDLACWVRWVLLMLRHVIHLLSVPLVVGGFYLGYNEAV